MQGFFTFPINSFGKKCSAGVTLVEVLLSIFLFAFLFSRVLTAFAPTATDTHNQLRGYSMALGAANWHMNMVESEIDRTGAPSTKAIGKVEDVTFLIVLGMGEDIEILRNLQVLSTILIPMFDGKPASDMYHIKVEVRWGNHAGDNRPHRYKASRWKVKPYE